MGKALLNIENLSICYNMPNSDELALNKVCLSIKEGETVGLIGESGSGKTSLAMAIMGLLRKRAAIEGKIVYGGVDFNELSESMISTYRWKEVALAFQNNLEALNPVLTVWEQIAECLWRHNGLKGEPAEEKIRELFAQVNLEAKWSTAYPHQLSGGMRQKVLLAMALSCDPNLLIIDEPTSSLDSQAKLEITKMLSDIQRNRDITLLVISHEMQTIKELTQRIVVLYDGKIMEEGPTQEILSNPFHPYTRGLVQSSPNLNPYRDLWGIPDEINSGGMGKCPFYPRCNQRIELCKTQVPPLEKKSDGRRVACNRGGVVTLLRGEGIRKNYSHKGKTIEACRDCHVEIKAGEIVALIGESGSGKSTLANVLAGTLIPNEGKTFFEDSEVIGNSATKIFNGMQIVFQDPFSSINELLTVKQVVTEPLEIIKIGNKEEQLFRAAQALNDVQLPSGPEFLTRRCHTLSGGQRQRVALVRSLVMEPKLLIADEISSMLDPSTKANILRLLKGLQNAKGFAMLFITHDLALTQKIADVIYVMYKGEIVEKGPANIVLCEPQNTYTQSLIATI